MGSLCSHDPPTRRPIRWVFVGAALTIALYAVGTFFLNVCIPDSILRQALVGGQLRKPSVETFSQAGRLPSPLRICKRCISPFSPLCDDVSLTHDAD
jgi:hypothetical protein